MQGKLAKGAVQERNARCTHPEVGSAGQLGRDKALAVLQGHLLSTLGLVRLVAQDDDGEALGAGDVLHQALVPRCDILQRAHVCDVVDNDGGIRPAVVRVDQAVKALLPGCVVDLHDDLRAVHFESLAVDACAQGGLVVLAVPTAHIALQDAGLADAHGAYNDDLEGHLLAEALRRHGRCDSGRGRNLHNSHTRRAGRRQGRWQAADCAVLQLCRARVKQLGVGDAAICA